ncbi:GMC family oxidoreductase [Ponticoccus sp. SC2-23]|uniref:GMC oxidoreductase n=1 Tax=Alexandriicola marinus TaxID=2081710 RepID=UPI000FDB9AB4|nr:GMC family oxidoreductase [Alexandriicola marinus]MBM1220398.1 GMC family oxidoreductase [Ponticoccus sp. SC6-9]MBM1225084.1 GMC family oxidoreductase [Ponticoccus sp. SC6-15]MBM1228598.1 GMC family oxidoreductase [Ponticoccus sp. SC6-38]MBM1233765.1 GMC family oxidoreductase [Ponticoccus sp. SC6-45]MBM1239099.1 GMC family oxidoreductase [Ponticoccus sp. SC6-49]MBM1242881.1 GMC family oxidoreductase [Ponticoccus sp. SC2-64]MBM1247289.1 GMC family oxidoreductase [Ponticoccus sp. SC6-42]MB
MTAEALSEPWDCIVIGTGIGGGTAGRALAEAGQRVLFIEKGTAGHRTEETPLDSTITDPFARSVRGFWPDTVSARLDGKRQEFHAALGSGVGGSSVFYAATLERPEPHDLDHSADRPHPTGGWPVSHAEMRPWFDEAERLYAIHGEPDPLSDIACPNLLPPPEPSTGDRVIMARLRANGLNPYRLHAAVSYLDGCTECFGRKCPRPCKMDGRSAGVEPALATGRAAVLEQAEVTRLLGTRDRITGIELRHAGNVHMISAPRVILAAGALASPRLLLASASDAWPEGCANRNDQVGRNLMFHLNEMFALFAGPEAGASGPSKSVGFRDLYFREGQRLGMVQAMGVDAGYGEILHNLRQRAARSPIGKTRLVQELARLPAAIGYRVLGNAKLFVGLLEDFPLPENRVMRDPDDPGRIRFDYAISDELLARRSLFRKNIRSAFRGSRVLFLNHTPEPNFGHPSGTLRMGADPATSVIDADGRCHGIENLWVADASFMPTSMGVNPSLTIAAHALRVAARITGRQP